jgi:hypothetical protein
MAQFDVGAPLFKWGFIATFDGIPPLAVASCGFGNPSFEVVDIDYLAGKIHVASKITVSEVSMTVRGIESGNALAACLAWATSVGSGTMVNAPSSYKRACTIETISAGGGGGPRFTLLGCWPSSVELGEGDYTASDIQTATLTIQVDHIQ